MTTETWLATQKGSSMSMTDELPPFPLFDVSDPEMAFGADRSRYFGSQDWQGGKLGASELSRRLRAEASIFSSLFYSGGKLSDFGREWKPDIDAKKAMRALRALMCSYGVSHEQKEATVALALHHWTQSIAAKSEAA